MENKQIVISSQKTNQIIENYIKLHTKVKMLQEQLKEQGKEVLALFDSPRYKDSNFIYGDKMIIKQAEHQSSKVDGKYLKEMYPRIYDQVVSYYTVSARIVVMKKNEN